MSDPAVENVNVPNPIEVSQSVARIAEQSRRLLVNSMQRQPVDGVDVGELHGLGSAFLEMNTRLLADPARLWRAHADLWRDYMGLWQNSMLGLMGAKGTSEESPSADRRFTHEDWNDHYLFDFIKQTYLLTSRWVLKTVGDVNGMDERTARKVEFYARQFVDAISPTNFVLTNPEVLRAVVDSGGQNLLDGLSNFLDDIERGENGKLDIRMTDLEAFDLGRNVATTPGKVIYENELLQLIQYNPSTDTVNARPLLIIPPWINKFYILDLQPKNSYIKWCVDQGHTVFVISWVNPDESLSGKTFENYLTEGALAALDAIEQATGEREVNAVGYCLGGTLLASMLAWLGARKESRIASATMMTTMIDFAQPGELEVFIDEDQITALEGMMAERGFLKGSEMAGTFNMLRANDLIWSFFINNYLLGKDPFPFDLLYWNSDSTRMPAAMHSFYLRKMYLENKLCEPGGIELAGQPIDLGKCRAPIYFISAMEDHIAPWKSTYAGTQLVNSPVRFVLGGSGHIAGIINPPSRNKYGYWLNDELPADPDEWLAGASQHEGSWWGDWAKWVSEYAGGSVPAREPGDGLLQPLEDAPGSYVRVLA